jgi:hypothetical protein
MVISTHSQNFVNAFPKATICSVIDGVVTVKTSEGAQT